MTPTTIKLIAGHIKAQETRSRSAYIEDACKFYSLSLTKSREEIKTANVKGGKR